MTMTVGDGLARAAGAEGKTQAVDPGEQQERSHLHLVAPGAGRERIVEMYHRYGQVIYRRCLRLLRDREDARDVTQEVFIKLMEELDRTGARDLSIRWVYRVTTNHCLNILRESSRTLRDRGELHLEARATPAAAEPAEIQLARAVLSRFDPVTRTVAVAVFVDGMEYEEVAGLLGISSRTIGRKVERFLVNARKFLARSGEIG